jgi:hypothetical protein
MGIPLIPWIENFRHTIHHVAVIDLKKHKTLWEDFFDGLVPE